MNEGIKGRGIPWYENAAYYIGNFFTFGALWITKIVIKKAFIEAVGRMDFNIFIDTKDKTIKVTKSN